MPDTQEPVVAPVVAPQAVEAPVSVETPSVPLVASTEATPSSEAIVDVKAETKTEAPSEPAKTEASVESVLGGEKLTEKKDAPAATTEKSAETKAETPAEVKPEVKELPAYEPFKVAEGLQLDKEPLDAFTKILGEIETGKLDHLGMQEKGQALIDLAAKATTDSIARLNDYYVQIHDNNKKTRMDALKADPELGGEKLTDTISLLQDTVREYGGTDAQVAEFRKEITESGLDASPAICRLIYNMQQRINKYTSEGDTNRIVPGARPAPGKVKPYQQFYQSQG